MDTCRFCGQPIIDRWYEIQIDREKLAVRCKVGHKDIVHYSPNLDLRRQKSKHLLKQEKLAEKLKNELRLF